MVHDRHIAELIDSGDDKHLGACGLSGVRLLSLLLEVSVGVVFQDLDIRIELVKLGLEVGGILNPTASEGLGPEECDRALRTGCRSSAGLSGYRTGHKAGQRKAGDKQC